MTTRFPSGLTNVAQESVLGNLGAPDPSKFQMLFDDFFVLSTTQWAVVETQAAATQAVAAGPGGLILLTNSATIGDANGFATAGVANFQLNMARRMFAKARFSMGDVANENFFIGFGDVTTGFNPANGIYLQKAAGVLGIVAETASAVVSNTLAGINSEFTNNVQTVIGLEYDGRGTLSGYVNDRRVISVGVTALPAQNMFGFFGYTNVNAFANVATLDYLLFAAER